MIKINIDNLKDQLEKGTYFYYKCGLLIKGKVNMVLKASDDTLNINFVGGCVDVYLDKIETIKRPGNVIDKFEWCYIIKNYLNECLGYIGFSSTENSITSKEGGNGIE